MATAEEGSAEKRPYDNSYRRQKAILTGVLRSLEKDDKPEGERVPRRVRNFRKRRAKLPPNLVCPGCGEVTTASKSWVVGAALKVGLQPCCKRCWAKYLSATREAQERA